MTCLSKYSVVFIPFALYSFIRTLRHHPLVSVGFSERLRRTSLGPWSYLGSEQMFA